MVENGHDRKAILPCPRNVQNVGRRAKEQFLLTSVEALSPDEANHQRLARFHSHRVAGSHCHHRHPRRVAAAALAKAKAKAQQIGCLSNYRQLQFCWQM